MQYKCPQCGHISTEPGNCPMCGVPMVPVGEETGGLAPTPPVEPAPPATPPQEPPAPAEPPPPGPPAGGSPPPPPAV